MKSSVQFLDFENEYSDYSCQRASDEEEIYSLGNKYQVNFCTSQDVDLSNMIREASEILSDNVDRDFKTSKIVVLIRGNINYSNLRDRFSSLDLNISEIRDFRGAMKISIEEDPSGF